MISGRMKICFNNNLCQRLEVESQAIVRQVMHKGVIADVERNGFGIRELVKAIQEIHNTKPISVHLTTPIRDR